MEQRRQMGLTAALSVVTGESIALGIFLTPAAMARSLGSPLLLAAVWCGMGFMTLCGAICYSELAITYPLTGGEYVYLRQGYGTRLAFLYGWMSAAVMDPGIAAALAVGAAPYVLSLFGLSPSTQIVIPALILIGLAVLNYVGTRLSRRVMTTANLLKIAVLICLVLWASISKHATVANLLPLTERRPGSEPFFAAIAGATVSAFFSFGGWWEAAKIAGEVRNPRRNMPLAFTCGVLLVTAVYLLVSASFLMVVPLEKIVSNTAFVAQFGEALFGTTGGKVLSACVLLSVLGGLMALTMAAPRVYYAMAKDGAFFAPFGKLHPRFGTPANAVLLQTSLALLVLCFGAFNRILSFIIFSAVCFLALSVTTLFRMPQPVRRWWFPAAPMVFLLGCTIINLMILMHDPIPALVGLVIVLCGDPVRRFFFAKSTPTTNPLPEQITS
ncbi:APC family permease [Tunturiibacter gelidoferens]|uniref:APA family basic amino acid/polyamine antiporter n=1 Tax=Tunturiibacter gelidiferens TaxID=3069689 RepID=A0A9X0QFY3_9BACT|nr:amino acid permease [Edaphobacter lichenicola]MBB5329534.1 APA family basic amino acid/polyamine antiporter [Edaphobacter lichenicola]